MSNHQSPPVSAAPPHDEEAEASVLGAVMLAERWLDSLLVDVRLNADDFYRPRNRLIYQAAVDMANESLPIDVVTVAARLVDKGQLEEAGGKDYIETLVTKIPALGNTKQYGQIVKENAQLRRMAFAAQQIQMSIAERANDPRQLLEQAQTLVYDAAQADEIRKVRQVSEIMPEAIDRLERQALSGQALTGTTTGLRDLDELTGGLQDGNLIVVAARPSMGKSALVTNFVENAALSGVPAAFFSLEMSEEELVQRFVASQARLSGDAMRKGRLDKSDWPRVLEAAQTFEDVPIWIDESSDISALEIRTKARRIDGKARAKYGRGLGLIVVDYLQLLRPSERAENRAVDVAQMSRGLKILARELKVPVVAVSQLSRAVESRNPPRPQLSDLRESGAVEQDADVVMFVYREEYYNRDDPEKRGQADLIIAKNRNGPVGDVPLTFIHHYPKFANAPSGRSGHGSGHPPMNSHIPDGGEEQF